jgi:type IV secretion system protein VirB9
MTILRWASADGGRAALCGALAIILGAVQASASVLPQRGTHDERIRRAAYSSEEVYTLYGYVGYQIDLQFDEGEAFVGLASGDIEALSFVSQGNHLFIKPKAPVVGTNLTVLTNRRQYQFEYTASLRHPNPDRDEIIYAVRFTYPPPPAPPVVPNRTAETDAELAKGPASRAHNIDYWFCGAPSIKPTSAWDDGVHTWLTFEPRAELPAIFVRNEDGAESLLNFSVEQGAVVIQRVAHRFILRRGNLTACIVNAGFAGSGDRLSTNTVSPEVERTTRPVPTTAVSANGDTP